MAAVKYLCRDIQGIKYYDDTLNQWVLTQDPLTESLFTSKGYASIPNDIGLLDSYEILIYDSGDAVDTIELEVCPGVQHITGNIQVPAMDIDHIVVDTLYEPSQYIVTASVTPTTSGAYTTVGIDIAVDKLVANDTSSGKLFSVILFGKIESIGV